MSPPSFVSASVENYEGSVRDYLATNYETFKLAWRISLIFPHRVDELTRLLPHPEQMDVHVQEVLATGDAAKEDYRQEVLNNNFGTRTKHPRCEATVETVVRDLWI